MKHFPQISRSFTGVKGNPGVLQGPGRKFQISTNSRCSEHHDAQSIYIEDFNQRDL